MMFDEKQARAHRPVAVAIEARWIRALQRYFRKVSATTEITPKIANILTPRASPKRNHAVGNKAFRTKDEMTTVSLASQCAC